MPLADVLVHTAVPVVYKRTETEERIAGEIDTTQEGDEPGEGVAFDCFLQLPQGQEAEQDRRRRKIRRPTILYENEDVMGQPFVLSAEDELDITAEELTGPESVRWKVEGEPEPLARPGELIGFQARLRRVSD